jgi:TolB-like protein
MLTKQELIDSIWPDTFVDEHNLVVHMSELRKILGSQQEYVATVARMGYRFVAEVRSSGDTAAHTFGNVAASRWNGFARQGVTSLAILPFKELRNKDEAEDPYLGIGLADGLITRLSALRNIVVRSTSAVRRYAGEGDPLAAARVLKVDLVLDGSLRRIGDRIRVTAQLLAVPDASTLWAGTYDECSADILALEDSLCEKVAASLVLELTSAENRRLTRHPTDNVRAYTSYMLGNALWSKHTPDDIGNSITYFEEAIRLDENFAAAYIGLARAKISLFAFSLIKLRDCYLEIEELLDRALELDCYLPEAHSYKAQLRHQIHLDWAAAEHEHQTAINVGHNCAFAYENYALYLAILGRTDEALALNQIAQVLEPTSLLFSISRGKILILGRQYQTAISELKPLVAVGKDPISYFILGLGYDMVGEYRKAQRLYTRYGGIHGVNPEVLAALCYSYASAGDLPKAREVL